jgi:hypothetical protein
VSVTDGSLVGLLAGGAAVVAATLVGAPVATTGWVPVAAVVVALGAVLDCEVVAISAVLNVTAGDDDGLLLLQLQPITTSAVATARTLCDGFGIMRITTHGRCGLDLLGRR